MSSFGWLDYSEHDRRRTLDVIDLFREKDTRDELGIGTVRARNGGRSRISDRSIDSGGLGIWGKGAVFICGGVDV